MALKFWPRRRRRPPSRRLLRPWQAPLALVLLVNAAALGYRITQGWDWGDCYWMVLITLSTLGFSDPHTQVLNGAGRTVTALSLIGGLVVVQFTIQALLGLSESGYFRRLRERRYLRWLSTMQNHVILCGYGRIGREIGEQLAREGVPFLVVEMDPERRQAAEDRGLPVLMADATLDETLLEAGIHRCRSLVAALSSNAANLYVVLSARGLAPQCRLIARSDSEEAERKLRLAGADQVVSPYVSGGRTMAATALRPLAVTFMDLLAGSDCEIPAERQPRRPGQPGWSQPCRGAIGSPHRRHGAGDLAANHRWAERRPSPPDRQSRQRRLPGPWSDAGGDGQQRPTGSGQPTAGPGTHRRRAHGWLGG